MWNSEVDRPRRFYRQTFAGEKKNHNNKSTNKKKQEKKMEKIILLAFLIKMNKLEHIGAQERVEGDCSSEERRCFPLKKCRNIYSERERATINVYDLLLFIAWKGRRPFFYFSIHFAFQ